VGKMNYITTTKGLPNTDVPMKKYQSQNKV